MTAKRKQIARSFFKRLLKVLLPLFSLLFIAGTTAFIIIIVNGYTIDIRNQSFIKTGVLNIETAPSDAAIYIDGEYNGNSNRAIPNIAVGSYKVDISKEGYFGFSQKIDIRHGLATVVTAPLIKQVGADLIIETAESNLVSTATDGFYILDGDKEIETKATLTHYFVFRQLFDIPRPATPETMTLSIPSGYTFTKITTAPQGKNILLELTNTTTKKSSLYIVAFRANQTETITQSQSILEAYTNQKDFSIEWTNNPDFLLIDSKTQIISYNIRTGARIILQEKPSEGMIWTHTNQGIVWITRSNVANTYSISQVSFNGSSILTPSLSSFTLASEPEQMWAESENDRITVIISTETGSYLLGNMFENKNAEYEINSNSTQILDLPITSVATGGALVRFTETPVSEIFFYSSKYYFAYLNTDKTMVSMFTYNKRAAEHYIKLGANTLVSGEEQIVGQKWAFGGVYFAYTQNNNLQLTDISGVNTYSVQYGVHSPEFFYDDTALIYQGDNHNLYFKALR